MATARDVRRIALSLPGARAERGGLMFSVHHRDKAKGFAWVWRERVDPKKARVPNATVWAIRVASLFEKDLLLEAHPKKLFTEPHYDGYPAVLIRLAKVNAKELRAFLTASWRCQAPRALLDARKK